MDIQIKQRGQPFPVMAQQPGERSGNSRGSDATRVPITAVEMCGFSACDSSFFGALMTACA
jgi:hypothetical protein